MKSSCPSGGLPEPWRCTWPAPVAAAAHGLGLRASRAPAYFHACLPARLPACLSSSSMSAAAPLCTAGAGDPSHRSDHEQPRAVEAPGDGTHEAEGPLDRPGQPEERGVCPALPHPHHDGEPSSLCLAGADGLPARCPRQRWLGVGAFGGRVAFLHLPPGAARPFPPLFSPAALPPPLHAPGPPFTQQTSTGPADLSAAHQCLSCLRPPPPRPPPRPLQFGTPEEDALRRDFTINSLFYNLNTGAIEDYSRKGLDDLREGIIRTPLPPKETFLDGVCVCVCA